MKTLLSFILIFIIPNFSDREKIPPKKPNIIYVLADDMGYGDLSCYGQQKFSTPNIDKMASEGVRYTDFHAGSTVCAPSRCALMTGKSMGHATIRGNGEMPLQDSDYTIAEYLKENGYRTGMYGKWGLGLHNNTGSPENQGWDEFLGYTNHVHAHHAYTRNLWTIKQGKTVKYPTDTAKHTHLYMMEAAMDFVKNNKGNPFFMYLSITMPHAEIFSPTKESIAPFLNNDNSSKFKETPFIQKSGNYRSQNKPNAHFAGMINQIDMDMGRLMEMLKTLNIDDNTYIFFTSDNGPHKEGGADPDFFDSNGPLRGIKRDLYEGGIRVPFIAWGGKVKTGHIDNTLLANWDVFSTIEELVGGKKNEGLDGVSFVNTLKGKKIPKKGNYYWEFYEKGFDQAVRIGNWKAVRLSKNEETRNGEIELYNLSMDLGEQNDVAKKYPKIVQQAKDAMDKNRIHSDLWPRKGKKDDYVYHEE